MRLRPWLGLAVLLASCSGGDSSSTPSVPTLPWGSFRHDNTNSALASSGVGRNTGKVTLAGIGAGEVTISTPAIDAQGNLYLGTASGLLSLERDGAVRWLFDECDLSGDGGPCPSATCIEVGRVTASPYVSPGGVIVFGSDGVGGRGGGHVFAVQTRGDTTECLWAFQPQGAAGDFTVRSSAIAQVYSLDLSLVSTFVGTGAGRLQAINNDGSSRWAFPLTGPGVGRVNSSPAIDASSNLYFTAPNGALYALDFGGRLLWQFAIGVPPTGDALLPSPAVATSVYAIGGGGSLFAITPGGSFSWQFTPAAPVIGSPAFAAQTFEQDQSSVLDTIVYVVDTAGTLYGVRDLDGSVLELQRCSEQPDQSCRPDSCSASGQGRCDEATRRCSLSSETCTTDSCQPDNGTCILVDAVWPVAPAPVSVRTSPALSGDLFAVVATDDGQLCARALDGTVPGDADDATNPWSDGCVSLGAGAPARSSPVIGQDGAIYVTTDAGLYSIK